MKLATATKATKPIGLRGGNGRDPHVGTEIIPVIKFVAASTLSPVAKLFPGVKLFMVYVPV